MQLCTVRMVELVHVHICRKANHYYEILLRECWYVSLNYKKLNTLIPRINKGGIREFISGQLIR